MTVTGSLALNQLGSFGSGITFAGDTTLFREQANVLKTGNDFIVGGSLIVSGAAILGNAPTLTVTGSLALNEASLGGGITFESDVSLFRTTTVYKEIALSNYLKTGGSTGGDTRLGRRPVGAGPGSWMPFCRNAPGSHGI